MSVLLSDTEEIDPEWLTAILKRERVLTEAQSVVQIETTRNRAFNSRIAHLKAICKGNDNSSIIIRLLLKCNLGQDWAIRAGAREVDFYQTVRSLSDHPNVVVRCYDLAYDPSTGNSHVLMDDLSASHVVPVERNRQMNLEDNLPSVQHLEQAIDALAKLHAYWWEHPRLGAEFGPVAWGANDEKQYRSEIERNRQAWESLLAQERDFLPIEIRATYTAIFGALQSLWQTHLQPRIASNRNLTLTHNDAYLANFLCPRQEHPDDTCLTYLIDWQSPGVYRGASDLVNMCATFWTRKTRLEGERERNVLRLYFDTLQRYGVSGYSWDDLLADYRCSIIDWLLVPLQDFRDGAGKAYWLPKMLCLQNAFEDWACIELLKT